MIAAQKGSLEASLRTKEGRIAALERDLAATRSVSTASRDCCTSGDTSSTDSSSLESNNERAQLMRRSKIAELYIQDMKRLSKSLPRAFTNEESAADETP